MRQFEIRFSSSRDVLDFVSLATAQNFPIQVGTDTYCVSGTSFMGMFSLDYSRPVKAMCHCNDEQFAKFFQAASRFAAK